MHLNATLMGSSIDAVLQGQLIRGTIVDKDGVPVIGANIIEKGTSNGTITDLMESSLECVLCKCCVTDFLYWIYFTGNLGFRK